MNTSCEISEKVVLNKAFTNILMSWIARNAGGAIPRKYFSNAMDTHA